MGTCLHNASVPKSLSIISPLNWALNSFYDILIRNASLSDVLHYGVRLVLFSAWLFLQQHISTGSGKN
jgi:hypothetical protein